MKMDYFERPGRVFYRRTKGCLGLLYATQKGTCEFCGADEALYRCNVCLIFGCIYCHDKVDCIKTASEP